MAVTNQQLLDAIQTELHARVTGTSIPDYTMPDGRSIRKIESSELRQLSATIRTLAQEEALGTAGGGGRSYVAFGRPK